MHGFRWLQGHFELSLSAMSDPNGLLSQMLYHYLDQGHTLADMYY